ncbi:CRE-GEI-6 protein [Caenorhabditis remanei]|uniref:CRE-GEI-6 protein n=1 Tax=Caenorhabditis remanei TaxID=31234 RepID=E3NTK9_CAERE|nr:CRE-GEI-6 protein [Caenorhabditis remanei]
MEELTDDPEDITGTRIPVDKTDDLIQGPSTSQIDETSNESATSSGKISNPSEPLRCETCCEMAVLKVYKQKQLPNGGKIEDIFKNYCNKCEVHFGMCSKKVRGVYSYVTEEGRILTNAEKLEYFRSEKRKRSSSRPIEEKSPPPELKASSSEISTSSNGSSNGSSEEKDEGIEDIGDEAEEAPESPPESSGAQEGVVAEPQPKVRPPRKKAKKPLFGGKRPKTNWSSSKKKKTPSDSVAPVRRVTPPKKAEPKVKKEDVKKGRGRPPPKSQNSQKDIPSTSSASSSSSIFMQRPLLKPISTESSSCQTDLDMLLKSTYLLDAYNETMREGLGERISARLKDQPLILRKQYLLMLKTIQAQAKDIAQYRELEQKYKNAVEHLQAFGRATRMNFSDELRSLRADMVERKKEFQDHETEMMSMFLREKKKYDAYKEQMSQKYEDQQLEYSLLEAKYQHLEQENVYEKERAEYFLQQMDRAKSKIYSAEERANTSERKLKDRLFLANNERCTGCDARESIRTKLMGEYADMKVEVENAKAEKEEALKKAALFETAAMNLGKDCDAMKYESNTWKAYAERYKKDVQKLQQIIKEKEKELADKAAETPRSIATPKSVALTPIYPERITPPEDGELPATPPQGSATPTASKPVEKPVEKPLAQKVIEKKAPPPIASGFESWIPKEKLNAPPPEIPKAVSAFGVPIKTPQQKEAERPKLAPSTQPLPWETMAKTVKTSDSLAEALSRAQADAFSGNGNTPVQTSKSYLEEMNRMVNVRKRVGEEVEKSEFWVLNKV